MLVGLSELLGWREIDRARFAELRRDRKRARSRRSADGVSDLTVERRDALNVDRMAADRTVQDAIDRGLVAPNARDATVCEVLAAVRDVGLTSAEVALVAWQAAWALTPFTADDWLPRRYVLNESGARKVIRRWWLAERMAYALRAGYGRKPAATVDAWWLVTARCWLGDHEIGRVLVAADNLEPGRRGEVELRDALERAGAGHDEERDDCYFAKLADKRWQRLRQAGWVDGKGDLLDVFPAMSPF
jgi:hypothetical protein